MSGSYTANGGTLTVYLTGISGSGGTSALTLQMFNQNFDGGSGQFDGGNSCPGDNGSECSTNPPLGNDVAIQQVAENSPNPTGGSVPAGTYVLVSEVTFTGPNGPQGDTGQVDNETVVLSYNGAQATLQVTDYSQQCNDTWKTLSGTLSGSTLNVTQTCPSCTGNQCSGTASFSWDGTYFTLYILNDQGQTTADTYAVYNPGADAGMQFDGGSQCGASTGGSCNTIGTSGPYVQAQNVALSAPAANGGSIQPGLYVLTGWTNTREPVARSGPRERRCRSPLKLGRTDRRTSRRPR
jgi:hypothetical protein